jgi:hypothetical protein
MDTANPAPASAPADFNPVRSPDPGTTRAAAPSDWLMGGLRWPATRALPWPQDHVRNPSIGAQRNKVNVALPFSKITAEDPTKMKVGDWFSLAGLVISVIGFGVAIRLLIPIAKASEADQGSHRANREEAH